MSFKNISVVLSANVTTYKAQMGAAAAATRDFGKEAAQVATRTDADARRTLNTLGKIGVVTAAVVAAGFGLATREAMEFERSMRNVNSISGMSEAQLADTGAAVRDIARDLPQSANTLAKGLYDIASSGFAGAEGLQVLKASAMAASAGLTTTEVSALGITAVLNAYGLSAAESGRVSDVLFQTVNKGVVTFEELAGTLGDFVGSAAAAGVPIEEASAALATMTLSGISAAEAGTSLNRVLQALIDPSDAMKTLLASLGYESGLAAVETLGLKGTVDLLRTSTGGQIEQLVKLFPEIRAARGALALMSAEGQNYNEVAGAFSDKTQLAGVTARVLAEQSKSLSYQLGLLGSSAGALAIEIGNGLIPVIRPLAGFLGLLVSGFADLPDPIKTLAGVMVGLVAITAGVGGGFLLLAPRIKQASDLFSSLATAAPRLAAALRISTLSLGAIGVALAAGAAILAVYTKRKEEAREVTERYVEALKAEREGTEDAVKMAIVEDLQKRKLLGRNEELGASTDDLVRSIMGEQEAVQALSRDLLLNLPATARTAENQKLLVDALNGSDAAAGKLRRQFLDSKYATDTNLKSTLALVGTVGDLSDANTGALMTVRELDKATKDAGVGADDTRQQLAQLGDETQAVAEKTGKLTEAQKALGKALESFVDPVGVYDDLISEMEAKERRAFDKGQEDRRRREDDALAETRRALERRHELERRALGDHKGEEMATLKVALAGRHELERRAATDRKGEEMETLKEALADKQRAEKEAFDNQAEQTKRGREDWDEFQGSVKVSLAEYAKALEEQIANQESWQNNLVIVSGRAGADVALTLAAMGEKGTALVAQMATGTEVEVERMATALRREAALGGEGARDELEKTMLIMQTIATAGGHGIVERLNEQLRSGKTTFAEIVAEYGAVLSGEMTKVIKEIGGVLPDAAGVYRGYTPGTGFTGARTMADGGILSFYAAGGTKERHQAQIARAGDWRVWAEPETGGEAYIPLSPSKRGRSLGVLAQVADAFGVGLTNYASGGSSHPLPSSPIGGGPGIDYERLGAVLARHLGGRVEVTQNNDFRGGDVPTAADMAYANRALGWELMVATGGG